MLYTRKLATSPTTSAATLARNPAGIRGDGGLGFLSSSSEVLPISFVLTDPRGSTQDNIKLKGKKGKNREVKEVAVDLEICQDLDGLRNRKGDTGTSFSDLPLLERGSNHQLLISYRISSLASEVNLRTSPSPAKRD